jgi:hypothetical protein
MEQLDMSYLTDAFVMEIIFKYLGTTVRKILLI